MAPRLRHQPPAGPLSYAQHTFPRIRVIELFGVHMEQEESGNEVELSGLAGVHGAISALGFDGVQLGLAWDGAEG